MVDLFLNRTPVPLISSSPPPSWRFPGIPLEVPFCLPERLLGQLHNSGMAERARKQVERVRSLYPGLMRTLLSHPKTAGYAARKTAEGEAAAAAGEAATAAATKEAAVKETDAVPMALLWAFAMVRSRAFAADGDRFAFVPFLVRLKRGLGVREGGEWRMVGDAVPARFTAVLLSCDLYDVVGLALVEWLTMDGHDRMRTPY